MSRRLRELRRHLLPARFDPTGTYPDRIHERARAFRLLIHAEFEAYIEDRVSEVAHTRFLAWKTQRKASRCLVSLVAYYEGAQARNDPTSLLTPPPPGKQSPLIEERIERAKNALTTYAKTYNHGVREANLLKLLLPLGVEIHELDMMWLSSIDSWAATRGEYAHQSGTKIRSLPDPQDELRMARALLKGFKTIDLAIDKL